MEKAFVVVAILVSAVMTALGTTLIAHDLCGMPLEVIRVGAFSAAGLVIATLLAFDFL
jgi:hypothetical protein